MKITSLNKLKPKKLVVFDFDGTLAETKSPMDKQMSTLLTKLLVDHKVAVIGGGKYELFRSLMVDYLKAPKKNLQNFYLFPTTATSFYRYNNGWKNVYYLELSKEERQQIKRAFPVVFKEIGYIHPKTYGKVIEDRGTQITFSALGQDIVKVLGKKKGVAIKKQWTRDNTPLKMKIAKHLARHLPKLEVRAAGYTSIDVTRKGIDKAYGLKQIEKHLKVKIKDMVFVGDAIFPGGNDYAVTKTPVDYVKVKGPEETKKVIRHLLQK
jgi:phosphomannomutase